MYAVGEAGAIFLLINPGSSAAGTGEAQVAKANDAYATYYNPAGLGFLDDSEVVLQHVNWLPNLADDIFYDFVAYSTTCSWDRNIWWAYYSISILGEQHRYR